MAGGGPELRVQFTLSPFPLPRCLSVSLWNSPIPVARLSNSSPVHGTGTRSLFVNKAALVMFGFTHDGLGAFLETGDPV